MKTTNKEEIIKTTIGNIKKFRELKDITREQMAADLDLSVSGYAKLERGEIEVTLNRLVDIASVLDVEISQLLSINLHNVFNISNSQGFQGNETKGCNYFQQKDDYREKYIALLEQELERLKNTQS